MPHIRRVRVLHLITGLGVGGAETMLLKLLTASDRARFPASVVSMTVPGALAPRFVQAGIPVHSLGMARGIPHPRALFELIKILREFRPDILQGWMYHSDILGLLAGRLASVPKVVWNIRCSDLDIPKASTSLRTVFATHAALSRFSDATVVNSIAGMNFHRTHGHSPPRWELIRNGFDLERFRADPALRASGRTRLGLGPNVIAIGMIARFDQFKDHATFISAAKLLHRTEPNTIFVLAGRGLTAENAQLVGWLRAAGINEHTRLLGECPEPAELLPCLDIATLCTHTEGFPNAIGEAMSAELSCVATDVGDSAQLIGETGRLVPPRAPEAVAACWRELIALGAEGRRVLGVKARARIAQYFSLSGIVSSYESLYSELASQR